MSDRRAPQDHGPEASSAEFARYDQVPKADYHLAESADGAEAFDDDFRFITCDLGRWMRGDAHDRRRFADELGRAMADIGFAILTDHGVDARLFDEAEEVVEELFERTSLAGATSSWSTP